MFLVYTLIIYLAIIGIGISVDSVEAVFNIVGAVCSTSIGMILPAYFYFILIVKKNKKFSLIFYLAILMFAVTIPFAIFAVVSQYIK